MTVLRSLSQALRRRTRRLTGSALAALAVAGVTAAAAAAAVAPVNTAAPAITGTATVGSTLTSSTGTWTGDAPIAFTYLWQRCDATPSVCAAITGATAQTYVPEAADVGGRLLVAVTATNATGNVTSFSAATAVIPAPVVPVAPGNTVIPSITGSAVVGSTLTGALGTWTGTAPVTSVQAWQRCDAVGARCAAIAGATALTYLPVAGDVGSTLRLSVTSSNAVSSQTVASAATAAVTAAPVPVPPVITPPRCGGEHGEHGRGRDHGSSSRRASRAACSGHDGRGDDDDDEDDDEDEDDDGGGFGSVGGLGAPLGSRGSGNAGVLNRSANSAIGASGSALGALAGRSAGRSAGSTLSKQQALLVRQRLVRQRLARIAQAKAVLRAARTARGARLAARA